MYLAWKFKRREKQGKKFRKKGEICTSKKSLIIVHIYYATVKVKPNVPTPGATNDTVHYL